MQQIELRYWQSEVLRCTAGGFFVLFFVHVDNLSYVILMDVIKWISLPVLLGKPSAGFVKLSLDPREPSGRERYRPPSSVSTCVSSPFPCFCHHAVSLITYIVQFLSPMAWLLSLFFFFAEQQGTKSHLLV